MANSLSHLQPTFLVYVSASSCSLSRRSCCETEVDAVACSGGRLELLLPRRNKVPATATHLAIYLHLQLPVFLLELVYLGTL